MAHDEKKGGDEDEKEFSGPLLGGAGVQKNPGARSGGAAGHQRDGGRGNDLGGVGSLEHYDDLMEGGSGHVGELRPYSRN